MSDASLTHLLPCPFCGARLVYKPSWAKSFEPNRLYHEYRHPLLVDCFLRGMHRQFVDDEHDLWKTRAAFIEKWNERARPLRHRFWGAGEVDCPRDIKAGNGELHTLRCKVCGLDDPRDDACRGFPEPEDGAVEIREAIRDRQGREEA